MSSYCGDIPVTAKVILRVQIDGPRKPTYYELLRILSGDSPEGFTYVSCDDQTISEIVSIQPFTLKETPDAS